MAGFKTHLIGGMVVGGALAASGYLMGHIDLKTAGATAILGTLGGLLPDLDSDTGKPLELLFQLFSVMVPMLAYPHVKARFGGELTVMVIFFTLGYLAVQYLLCPLIKKITVHRGIMHSIPFTILSGQITYLLFSGLRHRAALYCGLAVSLGSLIHLFLDEFHAISFKRGRPRFNRSSGTALAFYSTSLWVTIIVYLSLLMTTYIIFGNSVNLNIAQLMRLF